MIDLIQLFALVILSIDHAIDADQFGSMPSKQTRRSISVRGTTYDALKIYCEQHDRSMSDIVEEQLAALLGLSRLPAHSEIRVERPLEEPAPKIAAYVARAKPPVTKPPAPNPTIGRPAPTPASKYLTREEPTDEGEEDVRTNHRAIQF